MNLINKFLSFFSPTVVAVGMTLEEVTPHWIWLEANLLAILDKFDHPADIHDFVRCKVESLVANMKLEQAKSLSPTDAG